MKIRAKIIINIIIIIIIYFYSTVYMFVAFYNN